MEEPKVYTPPSQAFVTDLLALRPRLHAFAIALTRNGARAEDLVQETLARALKSHHQYSPDTSLAA